MQTGRTRIDRRASDALLRIRQVVEKRQRLLWVGVARIMRREALDAAIAAEALALDC